MVCVHPKYRNKTSPSSSNSEAHAHVCGLQGYNPMIDPPCPGCEMREANWRRSKYKLNNAAGPGAASALNPDPSEAGEGSVPAAPSEKPKAPGAIDQRDRFGMSAGPLSSVEPSLVAGVPCPRCGKTVTAPLSHMCQPKDLGRHGEKLQQHALHAGTPTVRRIVELERELAELSAINHRLAANQIGLRSATAPLSADERETIEIAANVLQLLGGDDNSIVESDLRVILRRTDNRVEREGKDG
jgi:hypothetical protein